MLQRKTAYHIKLLLLGAIITSNFYIANVIAKTIYIPIYRSVKNQPITKLEVVAIVKSKHKGRILSVKMRSRYSNPDCFHVKLLEDKGEFQLLKLGCRKKSARK